MEETTACPVCTMTDLLEADGHLECVTCGHEWAVDEVLEVRDANGTLLADGDTVVVAKELKVKGSGSMVLKLGTRITGIRLVEGDENVDCKVDGVGLLLKGEYLKKS